MGRGKPRKVTVASKVSLFVDPSAQRRLERADAWLEGHEPSRPVLVLSGSRAAAMAMVRRRAERLGQTEDRALFGTYAMTLGRLVSTLAIPELARQGLTPASRLSLIAVCARIVHQLGAAGRLGRYQPIAHRPGLPAAFARTIDELRMAEVAPASLDYEQLGLRAVYMAYLDEIQHQGLADRAIIYQTASRRARDMAVAAPPLGIPFLLLDVDIATRSYRMPR